MDPSMGEALGNGTSPASPKHEMSTALQTPQEPTCVDAGASSAQKIDAYREWNLDDHISVDSEDDDCAIGDLSGLRDNISARGSLFESVKDEDGRTNHRHGQGKYMLSNDVAEQNRLNKQHQLWLLTLHDRLSLAPLEIEPCHVLDLGTGTGIWAIDYALEHPTTNIIGTDLSRIQPSFAPANCAFAIEDFEDEWKHDQKFDLIHGRLLLSSMSNPKRVFEQAYAHLAPGGYLEMQDGDFPARCGDDSLTGTKLGKWYDDIVAGAAALGLDVCMVKHYKRWMEEVGFVQVEEKFFPWPSGTWPRDLHLKKVGFQFQHDLLGIVTGLKPPLMRGLGWSPEEVDRFHVEVKKDVQNRNIHAYHFMRIVYGMKPK